MSDNKIPTPTTDPSKDPYVGEVKPIKPAMTQQQCENWIVLKAQTGERWFEVKILDEIVGQDPTMIALMESVSEMIFAGIKGMPFTESETLRAADQHELHLKRTKISQAVVGLNGKPLTPTP